jgi:hypothetical protein
MAFHFCLLRCGFLVQHGLELEQGSQNQIGVNATLKEKRHLC